MSVLSEVQNTPIIFCESKNSQRASRPFTVSPFDQSPFSPPLRVAAIDDKDGPPLLVMSNGVDGSYSPSSKMSFDDLLFSHVGEMGNWQKLQFVLVCLPTMITAMHALSWSFAAHSIPSRCTLPSETRNSEFYTNLPLLKATISCGQVGGERRCEYEACSVYENGTKVDCPNGHVFFKPTPHTYSAIERWDIVCERGYIKATVQAAYYVGQMVGSIVFGHLGDRIGRKRVFCLAILIEVVCGFLESVAPYWWLYALLRAGKGSCHPGIFVISVVIGTELVGPRHRKLASVVTGTLFGVGEVLLGIEAYFIRNYQLLHVIIAAPSIIFLSYWWIVPESVRWLVSKKRYDEADNILQKAAKMNKIKLPHKWWELLGAEEEAQPKKAKVPFVALFKTPVLRKRTLSAFFIWPVVSMVYYGLSMNANVLGGDIYLNFIVGSIIEIPACVVVYFTLDRLGRKLVIGSGFIITALGLFSNLFVHDGSPDWLSLLQFLVTKAAITATYASIYGFSPELFPTLLRNSAMGVCSMIARIGAITASYVSLWLVQRLGKAYLVVPFATLSVAAALVTLLLLPETAGRHLPETVDDIERSHSSLENEKASGIDVADRVKVVRGKQ